MLCKNFRNLTQSQKVQFIGELTHAVMNNDNLFNMGEVIIDAAKEKGVLDRVKFFPTSNNGGNLDDLLNSNL